MQEGASGPLIMSGPPDKLSRRVEGTFFPLQGFGGSGGSRLVVNGFRNGSVACGMGERNFISCFFSLGATILKPSVFQNAGAKIIF